MIFSFFFRSSLLVSNYSIFKLKSNDILNVIRSARATCHLKTTIKYRRFTLNTCWLKPTLNVSDAKLKLLSCWFCKINWLIKYVCLWIQSKSLKKGIFGANIFKKLIFIRKICKEFILQTKYSFNLLKWMQVNNFFIILFDYGVALKFTVGNSYSYFLK